MPDYEVGFGKPPKKNQWRKGTSGNPKGSKRRKKPQPLMDELADQLAAPVPIKGKKEKIPFARAFATQTVRELLYAPLHMKLRFLGQAHKLGLLYLHQRKLEEVNEEPAIEFTEEDRRLMEIVRQMSDEPNEEDRPGKSHDPDDCRDQDPPDDTDLSQGMI